MHVEVVYLFDVLLVVAYLCKPRYKSPLENHSSSPCASFVVVVDCRMLLFFLLVMGARLRSNQAASVVVGKSSEDDQDNIDDIPDTKSTTYRNKK